MYHQRSLKDVWLEASKQFPVLLLTGPRQVGKTTFLQHVRGKDRTYVTLDDPLVRALAADDPGLFLSRFEPPLLIDEIQYAPGLLPYIKMTVDAQRQAGQFWLTGSQQFLAMKGISESLAGRVGILQMLGFSTPEKRRRDLALVPFLPTPTALAPRLQRARRTSLKALYQDLWIGRYPALLSGADRNRELYYSSYVQTYLQRDVRDLAQVGDQIAYSKFIVACAARTGQLLNLSEIARDVGVSVPTAKSWLSILQASFQIYLLPPYITNVTKRLIKTPKLYFLDTGLCSYLTEWSSPQTLEAGAMSGAIFETHVFTEILKSYWHRGRQPACFYYRDKDGREIDLLLEQNGTLYPIEIKKTTLPKKDAIRTFSALGRLRPNVGPGAVICMTERMFPLDEKNTALPVSVL
ncbi:MAG: ATP-binding protein [Planctomycetes bacterium]|nr:ATP-binding protein [Planctomycetota bacterium]